MRNRYRLWACPEPGCAVASLKRDSLPCGTHNLALVEKIVRREDAPLSPKEAAEKMREAAKKVDEAAGNLSLDEMMRRMGLGGLK